MEIKLTNEQLALFFDKDLKDDTLSNGSLAYKITNPVLHIKELYEDEIEYELSYTPIATEYDKTVLLISIPMEYGVVYDSIILIKKDEKVNIYDIESVEKHSHIKINLPWTTYDFGTGQDYAPDNDHEDEFYKEVELYNTDVQSDAEIYLTLNIEKLNN